MKKHLTKDQVEFITEAAFSGNAWDLYDSIADAGLETEEFYQNSSDVDYMRAFAFDILFSVVDSEGNCAI
jgi:hypothetical protein